VALGFIEETSKEFHRPVAEILPFGKHSGGTAGLEPLQAFTDSIAHALGKTVRQRFRMLTASPAVFKENCELPLHCRSDHRQHQVRPLRVILLAKEENLRLAPQTFAVKELANCRSDIYSSCVHAQHVDPSDRDGSRAYDLAVSKKHVFSRYSDQMSATVRVQVADGGDGHRISPNE
jgi:hypothetical protein